MFGFKPLAERMVMQEYNTPPGGGSGGDGGEIPLSVLQRVAREGINPYSPEGQARAREIMAQDAAIGDIAKQIPAGWIQIDATHFFNPANGRVNELRATTTGKVTFDEYPAKESAAYLNSIGLGGGTGGSSGGGGGQRLASDDPRYWDLQYQQLYQQGLNMGLDAEAARQQALATLITNRNNTAVDTASLSAQVAKQAAEFAANPRDAVAELMYRNQVGGSTPFGDMTNKNFGEYGKALAEKAASIFSPVNQDLAQLRLYRDAIPPVDYFGAETRGQLGLPPTPAQALTGAGASPPLGAPAAPVNGLQALMDRLNSMNPQEQEDFRKWTTAASGTQSYAKGGQINFDGLYGSRSKDGYSPASSEGGTNLNLHERAIVVGESGHVYATLGEKRPDGSVRAESLQIKPLKSEVEKDKKLAEGKKAIVESQKQTMAAFAQGGTVNATPDDFMEQLRQYLGSLGGSGGGTGSFNTPLPSLRLLAGAPANALEDDPVALDYTLAGYSALGIDPRTVASTIKKFSPRSPINNAPRVSFA